eukprot:4126718-Amphidinium_carterae.2
MDALEGNGGSSSALVVEQFDLGMAADDGQPGGSASNAFQKINAAHRQGAADWIETDVQSMLVVTRRTLEPFRVLLQRQFYVSSIQYKRDMQAQIARQLAGGLQAELDYPVVVAARLELETTFFQQVNELYTASPWSVLLPSTSYTMALRGLIFRLASRAGCACQQLHVVPKSQYPVKAFKLIAEPQLAEQFQQESSCLKDSWTKHLQDTHGLSTQEARAILIHHAGKMKVDISSIEARHASIRRQLVNKSCQVATMHLTVSSSEWIFQNFRNAVYRGRRKRKGKVVAPTRRTTKSAPKKKKKKKKGGGGAWRAFVRKLTKGKSKPCSLKEIGQLYRAAKGGRTGLYQECQSLGVHATISGRYAVQPVRSNFGCNARDVAAKLTADQVAAYAEQHTGEIATDVSVKIVRDAEAKGMDIGAATKFARAVERHRQQTKHAAEACVTATLESFAKDAIEQREFLALHLPFLQLDAFKSVPSLVGWEFEVKPEAGVVGVVNGCAWASAHRDNKLSALLEQHWHNQHDVILESECKPCIEPKEVRNKCASAGICICSAAGKRLQSFKVQCQNVFRAHLLSNPSRKALLTDGHIVICIKNSQECFWYHIGLMYYSPLRATFQRLEETENPEFWLHGVADRHFLQDTLGHDINLFCLQQLPRALSHSGVHLIPNPF